MKEVCSEPAKVPEVHIYGLDMKQWEYRVEKVEIKKWPQK